MERKTLDAILPWSIQYHYKLNGKEQCEEEYENVLKIALDYPQSFEVIISDEYSRRELSEIQKILDYCIKNEFFNIKDEEGNYIEAELIKRKYHSLLKNDVSELESIEEEKFLTELIHYLLYFNYIDGSICPDSEYYWNHGHSFLEICQSLYDYPKTFKFRDEEYTELYSKQEIEYLLNLQQSLLDKGYKDISYFEKTSLPYVQYIISYIEAENIKRGYSYHIPLEEDVQFFNEQLSFEKMNQIVPLDLTYSFSVCQQDFNLYEFYLVLKSLFDYPESFTIKEKDKLQYSKEQLDLIDLIQQSCLKHQKKDAISNGIIKLEPELWKNYNWEIYEFLKQNENIDMKSNFEIQYSKNNGQMSERSFLNISEELFKYPESFVLLDNHYFDRESNYLKKFQAKLLELGYRDISYENQNSEYRELIYNKEELKRRGYYRILKREEKQGK